MNNYFYTDDEMESIFRSRPLQYESKYSLDELIAKMRNTYIKVNLTNINSIAVVGNSGNLLDKKYGEIIDSYDLVIRCNLGIVSGYEDHVGSKTDYRIISGKSFYRNLSDHFTSFDEQFLSSLRDQCFIIKAAPIYNAIQGIICNFDMTANMIFLNENFVTLIGDTIDIYEPSIGLTAISLSLQWSKKVSLFGFDFFQGEWNNFHYFEKIKPYKRGHDFKKENQYVSFLVENNSLRMF